MVGKWVLIVKVLKLWLMFENVSNVGKSHC